MKQNFATADKRGFDAYIIGAEAARTVFTRKPHDAAKFETDLKNLQAVGRARLKDSFVLMEATLGDFSSEPDANHAFDWFSDSDWASAERNVRGFSKLVGGSGLRGVFFDSEPYFGTRPWGFGQQPGRGGRSFADYQAQLTRRGAQFMRALEADAPGLTVFATRLLSTVDSEWGSGQNTEQIKKGLPGSDFYGLWPAFVEGMLEAASPKAHFIDGLEATYFSTNAKQFDETRKWALGSLSELLKPANRAKYKAQVGVSTGLYLEGLTTPTDLRFLGYYLPPTDRLKMLEHNVYQGLRAADEYAWIFTEQTKWWNGTPDTAIQAAVQRGRSTFQGGGALGFTSAFADGAVGRFKAAVNFAGIIKDGSGKGVAGVRMVPSAKEIICQDTDAGGLFTCVSVGGWSGTLTPTLSGFTFEPKLRSYAAVKTGHFGQGFTARK